MPYVKKSKKMSRSRRSRSYNARFRDRKINTAIERKIKDIAVREDNKNIQWFIKPKLILDYDGASYMSTNAPKDWPTINGKPAIDSMCHVGSEADPKAFCLTEIGGNLQNQGAQSFESGHLSNKYLVKRVEAHLTLRNQTNITKKCAVVLISMKNVEPNTSSSSLVFNLDNIFTLPFNINNKYAGMFKEIKPDPYIGGGVATKVSKQYTVLAQKVITLPPTFASNGGRVGNSNASESTGYIERDVHLSKSWKVGKRLTYQLENDSNASNVPCSNDNIYLCICSNGQDGDQDAVVCYGIAGVKYRLHQPAGRGKNMHTNVLPNTE